MARVKHVLKGREVIEAWLNQSQDWAKTSSDSVRFEGPKLYNDRNDVCLLRKELGNGHILFIIKSYHTPYYRPYGDGGYSADSMVTEYARGKSNVWKSECYGEDIGIGMIKHMAEDLPRYWYSCKWTREDIAGRVNFCVKTNFERLYNLRSFLKGADVTTIEQLDPKCDERVSGFVRCTLFEKVDAMQFFEQVCNLKYRKEPIDKAFGEGTLETMLQSAIAEHMHLLDGNVCGGSEYASFWAGI